MTVLADLSNLAFLDLEASGFEEESYPTEIGWAWVADGAIVSGSVLIRPPAEWRSQPGSWCPYAQEVTGITPEMLDRDGVLPSEAFTRFAAATAGRILVSDSPSTDGAWLRQIATAAGQSACALRLANYDEVAGSLGAYSVLLKAEEDAHRREPCEHRAEPDARRNALALLLLAGVVGA